MRNVKVADMTDAELAKELERLRLNPSANQGRLRQAQEERAWRAHKRLEKHQRVSAWL